MPQIILMMKFFLHKIPGFQLSIMVISVIAVSILLILPLENRVIFDSTLAHIWIIITNTGSTVGVGVFLIIISFILSYTSKAIKLTFKKFAIILLSIGVILGAVAFLNEHLIKERIKVERPSVKSLSTSLGFNSNDYYSYPTKKERSAYLQSIISKVDQRKITIQDKYITSEALQVWIKESGYSFPSGHSVTAFLLAVLIPYLFKIRYNKHKLATTLFFIWATAIAYSRVLLGVHSAYDVTLGAIWGEIIGNILILSGLVDKLMITNKA